MKEKKELTKVKKVAIVSSVITGVLALATGIVTGYYIYYGQVGSEGRKLIESYELLKDNWLYGNEEEYLLDNATTGLVKGVASTDLYTFYTKTQAEQGLSTDGNGLGFSSHFYDGGIYITEVHDGPSTGKLKIGDVIYGVTIGDNDYYDFTTHKYSDVSAYLASVNDTTTVYQFKVVRDGVEITPSISMTRGKYSQSLIDVTVSPSSSNDFTLGIKINTFLGNPTSALDQTISYYQKQTTVNKLILDLRGNGGGLVDQASSMAKLFVKKGTFIYSLVDKNGKTVESKTQNYDPTYSIPNYSLIIDENTASASEIFTLAMRAGTNAKVYGLKSYGKGIAQQFKTFSDGSTIRYTYAYVYGPERDNETMYDEGSDADKTMCIHGKGIIPDYTFTTDYVSLQNVYDYTQSLAVSENGMNYLLNTYNDIYSDTKTYNASYHFTDLVSDFADKINTKYSLSIAAFDDTGIVSKKLNDKIVKESYDKYLKYYSVLTNEVIGA